MSQKKRNKKGQFKAEYEWDILIPAILEEYVEKEISLANICSRPENPSYWQVWNVIKSNPEYQKEWGLVNWIRLQMLGCDFEKIIQMAEEAFYDKSKPILPLRLMLQIIVLKQNNFESVAARHGYL